MSSTAIFGDDLFGDLLFGGEAATVTVPPSPPATPTRRFRDSYDEEIYLGLRT